MEILAPAGNREALERAQAAGADAVYLGYAAFSARSGAGNFDAEEMAEAIRFAHLHHIRVYVTVNTLVRDGELAQVAELLDMLSRLHADGILVQDLGILRMARNRFPELPVHASTQMAIHNASGVRWCADMGIRRAVLARECSLEEIRRCVETGTEIEVFGHGAQCVSVSGECLFSSMAGERSGNRGRCAQPCRKMYRFNGQPGAWLSPRDLCLRDDLPALWDAGIASLKLEGRLKRPEYVYTVTDSYRRAADRLEQGDFEPADRAEKESLMQMFHRGGFMRGYAFGAEDAGVILPESVNHRGIRLGRVESVGGRLCRIRLERELHDGDGLRLIHGKDEEELIYSGPDRPAGEIATLRLREGMRAYPGDETDRLTDARQMAEAMAAPLRRIPVSMEMNAWPEKPLCLRVSDGEQTAEVQGEAAEAAIHRATAADEMEKQLRKTGGTSFTAEKITVRTEGAYVAPAAINRLRREALAALAEKRIRAFAFRPEEGRGTSGTPDSAEKTARTAPAGWTFPDEKRMLITVRNREQAAAVRRPEVLIVWYPEDFRAEALARLAEDMAAGDWIRLPETCEEETLQALRNYTERHRERLGGVMLGSIGQLGVSWPVPVGAGPGIPVMNRETARMVKEQGCVFVQASPELTGAETRTLTAPGSDLPAILTPVYGRTQLMLLHHCPARTAMGLQSGHRDCGLCDAGSTDSLRGKSLEDEEGRRFPLQRIRLPEGCLVRVLNMLPTDLGDQRISGIRVAEMTTETGEEAGEAADRLLRGERAAGESTRGHWKRPVL